MRAPGYFTVPGPSVQSIFSVNKTFAGPGPPTPPTPLSRQSWVTEALIEDGALHRVQNLSEGEECSMIEREVIRKKSN